MSFDLDQIFYGSVQADRAQPPGPFVELSLNQFNFLLQTMLSARIDPESKRGPLQGMSEEKVLLRPEWEGWGPLLQDLDGSPDGAARLLARDIRRQLAG